MDFLKKIALLALAALLAACVGYRERPLSPASTASAFQERSLSDPGLENFVRENLGRKISSWPPESWNLQLLTLTAFYFHPDLDVARAQLGVAKAAVRTARERPNPTL